MKLIKIHLQGEEITGTKQLTVDARQTAGELKRFLAESRRFDTGDHLFLFQQDSQYPLGDEDPIPRGADQITRVHLHRCRYVQVSVNYREQSVNADYAPGTCIGKIMSELVRLGFGLNQKELEPLELRIAGTLTRPKPEAHVGRFVRYPFTELALELVPKEPKPGPVKKIKQRYARRFAKR